MKFIDQVPWFALKMRILVMTHLMVMSPSSTKLALVLSLIGSEPSLVEIGESTFPILSLKCVLLIRQGRDQVHGLCWWETPTELKFYSFFSNLRHIEQDKVDVITWVVRSED